MKTLYKIIKWWVNIDWDKMAESIICISPVLIPVTLLITMIVLILIQVFT